MIESQDIINALKWLEFYRKRIILMFIVPIIITFGVYFVSESILAYLTSLLNGNKLYFLTPVEAVLAKIKLSFYIAIVASYPFIAVILINMFTKFISKKTRNKLYFILIPSTTLLMIAGMVFGFKFVLPTTLKFLIGSSKGFMQATISADNYVSFICMFILIIGIIFEIPVVLISLSRIGLVKYKMLKDKRKVVILTSVIIMAILTPTPDAFTLIAVSLPVIILFEISLWGIFLLEKINK
jgi:sec-independent protein translocase protein TatC